MDEARRERLKVVSHRYIKYNPGWGDECIYCGLDGFTKDHVPSVFISYAYHPDVPHIIVPCCRHCNSILGAADLNTLPERAAYLTERYEKKYKRLLDMPIWDEEDIKEMGPTMQDAIISMEKDRENIEYALEHLDNCVITYSNHFEIDIN